MEYGVYLESSIVDLKPRLMDFLNKIIDKAKEAKEYAVSFKRKDLAELTGVDVRTTSRYLNELAERDIVEVKGVRGRSGGTVVMLNTELIRFETSDKALVNQDVDIEDVVAEKFPKKKPKKSDNNKRNRRTKQQMIEERALNKQKQSELDRLHKKLEELGGVPNWKWFEETEDPVGNYKTYLLTRLYNRYAVLFVKQYNSDVREGLREGREIQEVTKDYDVLPYEFFGSARWVQFEKFRNFCDENGIDPAVYLSAQFNRSIYGTSVNGRRKLQPFVNTLIGESSVDTYKRYCNHEKNFSHTYRSYGEIPAKFMDDFVVAEIRDAYRTAESEAGLLQYRAYIEDFLRGNGHGEKEEALLKFYKSLKPELSKVSFKTRDTIKKYVVLQSLTLTGGASSLPLHFILSSETTRILLASINSPLKSYEDNIKAQYLALGLLTHPTIENREEQMYYGMLYYNQMKALHETPYVLRLIMQRKGLHLSLADIQAALKEFGKEFIPVDDYSLLDVDQIVGAVGQKEEAVIDHSAITDTRTWALGGAISNANEIEDKLDDFLSGLD